MRTPSSRRTSSGPSTIAGALALGVAVALAPALALVGAPEAAAQTAAEGSSTAPDRTAFYVPPAELPADPGAIIRTQPMTITPSLPDVMNGGALPADAQRIMYRSTGAAGGPIAVTGTFLQPEAP